MLHIRETFQVPAALAWDGMGRRVSGYAVSMTAEGCREFPQVVRHVV